MKTLFLALTLAGCAFADAITFGGVVTQASPSGPVQVGEAFNAWINFDVLSETSAETWTPGALDVLCGFSGECEGAPSGYQAVLGGVGVKYSGGANWSFPTWAMDGGYITLGPDLAVQLAGVSSGGTFWYGSASEPGVFSDNYVVEDSLDSVTGVVTSATYSQVPEPSSFFLGASALMALGLAPRARAYFAAR